MPATGVSYMARILVRNLLGAERTRAERCREEQFQTMVCRMVDHKLLTWIRRFLTQTQGAQRTSEIDCRVVFSGIIGHLLLSL